MKEIAELYGSELSLPAVQEYRTRCGVESITAKCLKAARISAVLIDDGLELHKKHDIEWHKNFIPVVGRILRIEHLAEKILDEVRSFYLLIWLNFHFTVICIVKAKSDPGGSIGLESADTGVLILHGGIH